MLDLRVTKPGTLLMHDGNIYVEGFRVDGGGMCREVAAMACLWAIGELQKELTALINEAGSGVSCMDLPHQITTSFGIYRLDNVGVDWCAVECARDDLAKGETCGACGGDGTLARTSPQSLPDEVPCFVCSGAAP